MPIDAWCRRKPSKRSRTSRTAMPAPLEYTRQPPSTSTAPERTAS
jgi:hypothetical protein